MSPKSIVAMRDILCFKHGSFLQRVYNHQAYKYQTYKIVANRATARVCEHAPTVFLPDVSHYT
jgi:hypothetical protein